MIKSISLHPKLAAVLDLMINLFMLWWVRHFGAWWMVWTWLWLRVVIWGVLTWMVYYPKEISRWKHLLSLVVMTVGTLAFLLFIEWKFAWYLFGLFFSFFSFYSFWLLPTSTVSLGIFLKPHLRWRFIMAVIGLAGIFEGAQAIISFQIVTSVSTLTWSVVSSVFAAVFAGWWWWEYGTPINKRFWIWVALWFVLMFELFWVVNFLPLGYLASSLILTWCWYALWLLARFNLTPEGVHWKKQSFFLSINSILFIIFLIFIVRWK